MENTVKTVEVKNTTPTTVSHLFNVNGLLTDIEFYAPARNQVGNFLWLQYSLRHLRHALTDTRTADYATPDHSTIALQSTRELH